MGTPTRDYQGIDWPRWVADEVATLMFVIKEGQVLLIRKKRGLGKGKINGPGGRLDPGESLEACAIREVQEELLVTPKGTIEEVGLLQFQFCDGYALEVHVFRADDYEGTATETDEAIPLWTALDKIPYDEMWADDRFWLPLMLNGTRFKGTFLFDDDLMLGHDIQEV